MKRKLTPAERRASPVTLKKIVRMGSCANVSRRVCRHPMGTIRLLKSRVQTTRRGGSSPTPEIACQMPANSSQAGRNRTRWRLTYRTRSNRAAARIDKDLLARRQMAGQVRDDLIRPRTRTRRAASAADAASRGPVTGITIQTLRRTQHTRKQRTNLSSKADRRPLRQDPARTTLNGAPAKIRCAHRGVQ